MPLKLIAIGLVAGLFSALFGVGGGIVIVPLLILLLGFEGRLATGTSLAAIGITALAGTILYAFEGHVHVGACSARRAARCSGRGRGDGRPAARLRTGADARVRGPAGD